MKSLDRFVQAQAWDYDAALREIQSGRKRSHWMWYVFPQIHGLGHSSTAMLYEIQSMDEAKAYLAHPVLGPRLLEITQAALNTASDNACEVFGYPDNLKLCSSMTLFEQTDPNNPLFGKVLEKFFGGNRDQQTLWILENDKKQQ